VKTILKRLPQLNDDDLLTLSEAIDVELEHRLEFTADVPDSARRRAVSRQHSYRRETGASAPPVRAVGLRDIRRRRAA
jgi:hypothetical protein